MALHVRLPDETFEYVLRADQDSDNPTVFTFRAPSARAQARLTQSVMNDRDLIQAMSEAKAQANGSDLKPEDLEPYLKGKQVDLASTVGDYMDLLDDCLISVQPVLDPAGKAMEMTGKQFLQVVDFGTVMELGPAVLQRASLSEGQAKNSDAQPEPGPGASAAQSAHE